MLSFQSEFGVRSLAKQDTSQQVMRLNIGVVQVVCVRVCACAFRFGRAGALCACECVQVCAFTIDGMDRIYRMVHDETDRARRFISELVDGLESCNGETRRRRRVLCLLLSKRERERASDKKKKATGTEWRAVTKEP